MNRKPAPPRRQRRGRVPGVRIVQRRSESRPAPRPRPDRGGPLHVEIITIGRELLRGRTADTNARYLAGYLSQRSAVVHRITIVDDRERAITSVVREALERGSHLVITTGGLGPAADDLTLRAVAYALRLPLAIHPHAKAIVEAGYRRLRKEGLVPKNGLTPAREKMCSIPVGSEPIPNEVGTAPGVLARLPGGAAVLCLPGVPEEMRAVLEAAMPRLRNLAPKGAVAQREVETPTADESSLRPLLDRLAKEFPAVWVKSHAPGFGQTDSHIRVTLEASAPTKSEAESVVEGALRRLLALAGGG